MIALAIGSRFDLPCVPAYDDVGEALTLEVGVAFNTGFVTSLPEAPNAVPPAARASPTGAVTGMSNLHLSGWQIVIVIAIVGLILLTSIISRTIIKLKKK